jgi:hypothetical protein
MPSYPTEIWPTANGASSYVLPTRPTEIPEAEWTAMGERLLAANLRPSPVDKIVGTFDVLRGIIDHLDEDGLNVLASCAEQITVNSWHGKAIEALGVRDAAVALLP